MCMRIHEFGATAVIGASASRRPGIAADAALISRYNARRHAQAAAATGVLRKNSVWTQLRHNSSVASLSIGRYRTGIGRDRLLSQKLDELYPALACATVVVGASHQLPERLRKYAVNRVNAGAPSLRENNNADRCAYPPVAANASKRTNCTP